MNNPEGAWIFLSHSTKDWNEVRRIRNTLEQKGHRPLVFFLKCLTDHSELDGLIKREIEARTWFLLCDSQNARESRWVQAEVTYIKDLKGKYHETIDLKEPIDTQLERIDRLCRRATVLLSHSVKDRSFANHILDALIAHEYSVWLDTSALPAGSNWMREITTAIDQAVGRGFVLMLLSPNSMHSQFVMHEIQYALEKSSKEAHGANVIPIMIDDPVATQAAMPSTLRFLLAGIQWFDFSKGDFDANMDRLIAHMKSRAMS